MDQIYIEALNEAKTLSDNDYLLIETSTEDLKISVGTLKQLLSVATADKLTNPFELTLSGDATGTATIDGSESVDIDVSQIKASSLKNDIKINGTPFDGQDGIVTDQWGKERQIYDVPMYAVKSRSYHICKLNLPHLRPPVSECYL